MPNPTVVVTMMHLGSYNSALL